MATRYRKIRKWGNSLVIVLKPSDELDLNIKVGDLVDIEDAVVRRSVSEDMKKRLNIK